MALAPEQRHPDQRNALVKEYEGDVQDDEVLVTCSLAGDCGVDPQEAGLVIELHANQACELQLRHRWEH